jgi:hypothetical protein
MNSMAMASVGAMTNVYVGIGRANELHPNICPNIIDSIPIGITTHTHTQRSRNNRNNYLALQNSYRRDAAPQAPVDGGQSFLSNAAVLAAFTDGQGGSGSGGLSSSAPQGNVSDLTGEYADARSRNNNTNYLALLTGYRLTEPPAPVDEAVAGVLATRDAMRAARDLYRERLAPVLAEIRGLQVGDSARPTTASQRNVIDPTSENGDAGSGNDNTDTNALAPLNNLRTALPPPPPVLVDANYPGSAADYAAARVARTEALRVHSAAMADGHGGSLSSAAPPSPVVPTTARDNTTLTLLPTGSCRGLVAPHIPADVDRAASAAGLASAAAMTALNARLARHRARDAVVAAALADGEGSSDDEQPPRKKRKRGGHEEGDGKE